MPVTFHALTDEFVISLTDGLGWESYGQIVSSKVITFHYEAYETASLTDEKLIAPNLNAKVEEKP